MINDQQDVDDNEEGDKNSLNHETTITETQTTDTQTSGIISDCPICLEQKTDIVALICGHTVCRECRILLIEHNQLNVCPLCRYPFNWQGLMQYYDDSEDNEAYVEVIGEVVREIIHTNVEAVPIRENQERQIRRFRVRNWNIYYNTCGALVFVILFWIMLSGHL